MSGDNVASIQAGGNLISTQVSCPHVDLIGKASIDGDGKLDVDILMGTFTKSLWGHGHHARLRAKAVVVLASSGEEPASSSSSSRRRVDANAP